MNRALRPVAALIPVAFGCYLFQIHRNISTVNPSRVIEGDSAPPSYRKFKAYTVVNPRGYAGTHDSRSIVIDFPRAKGAQSDEQILANLIEGFFGGWVLTPERLVLQTLRRKLVSFSQLADVEEAESIWTGQGLSRKCPPRIGSVLFGAFQVIDIKTGEDDAGHDDNADPIPREKYVDFGFGSDRSSFSGFHRWSLRREDPADDMDGHPETAISASRAQGPPTRLRITLTCFVCNPSRDKQFEGGLLHTFHQMYARLLFREAVSKALQS
ncbi:hypothetical protein PV04_04615 [Phialophora macrospora]|uniref:Uncharacterized protein n=1 Tax=Phialophora macrospora TaxID=1851006 RepID=A0A0D2CU13_9EURO|nr:hypothetical protein PV04_04615 [Phialophora macrospora]